jgi:hypothetical protein
MFAIVENACRGVPFGFALALDNTARRRSLDKLWVERALLRTLAFFQRLNARGSARTTILCTPCQRKNTSIHHHPVL